jgi:hypothetical protein
MNAGPPIVLRQGDHTGSHRIEFDIPQAPQQIVIGVDQAGLVTSLPKRACPPVLIVQGADVSTPNGLHHPRHGSRFLCTDQEVDMIGHQDIAMDLHALRFGACFQGLQITDMVVLIKEGGGAIDAAMSDVKRDSGEFESGTAHRIAWLPR